MQGEKGIFGKEGHALLLAVVLGFAAYKTAQGSLYSTAMLSSGGSFILISDLNFSLVAAAFVVAIDLAVIVLSAKRRLRPFSLPVATCSVFLCIIALSANAGLLQNIEPWMVLALTTFAQGAVTVVVTLAWIEMFACMDTGTSMKALAASMLVSAVLSSVLDGLLDWLKLPMILVLLVVNVVLYEKARRVRRTEAEERVLGVSQWSVSLERHMKGLFSIGEGLLSLLVFGCTMGVINGFMLVGGLSFEGSSRTMPAGALLAALAFFVMAFAFPKTFNVSRAYKVLFPTVTALLIIWPFAQFEFTYYFSTVFVAGYSLISTSVMYLIIYRSHKDALNPCMFMGISMIFIRLSSVVGLIAGSFVAELNFDLLFKSMLVIVIVLYLLSLALLFMVRTRKGERGDEPGAQDESASVDEFDQIAHALAVEHGLTDREREILAYLARGRTANYIGQTLYLSPNTVRGYIKSIYVKLDVHSKQEVIDLFPSESVKPAELR